jgi:hypothetical protein
MRLIRGLLLLCLCLTGGLVSAREIFQGNACTIGAEEIVVGNVFVLCEELLIAGRIEGNLIGGALRATITGQIDGSVYLVGGQVLMAGHIQREMHFAGLMLWLQTEIPDTLPMPPAVSVAPTIGGSVLSFSLTTRLSETVDIGGGLIGVGYQVIVRGRVEGEVNFWGSGLTIDGSVGGKVYASVGDPASDGAQIETLLIPFGFEPDLLAPGMTVTARGTIAGTLDYVGPVAGQFPADWDIPTTFTSTANVPLPTPQSPETFAVYISNFWYEALILLTAGLLGLFVLPEIFRTPLSAMRQQAVASVSVGMLAFILSFPIVLMMAVLSLAVLVVLQLLGLSSVAVVLGSLLALINFSSAGIFYFVAIFGARALVAFAIGRFVLRLFRTGRPNTRSVLLSMLVGALLLALLISLPLIGWVFNAAALFLGLGSILTTILKRLQTIRETVPTAGSTWQTLSAAVVPLPAVMSVSPVADALLPTHAEPDAPKPPPPLALMPPGMTNLPEGFDPQFFDER